MMSLERQSERLEECAKNVYFIFLIKKFKNLNKIIIKKIFSLMFIKK